MSTTASALEILPARGKAPPATSTRRVEAFAVWDGGPADLQALTEEGWRTIATQARSPHRLGRLRAGTALRTRREGVTGEPVRFEPVWRPVDLAAWSGPGLRGARVLSIAADATSLWAGTETAGVARWDGTRWTHLSQRDGLPSNHVLSVRLDAAGAWIASDGGVASLRADASGQRWFASTLGGRVRDVLPTSEGTTWVATDAGIVSLLDPPERVLDAEGCARLLDDGEGGVLALCDAPWLLPSATPVRWPAPAHQVVDALPRMHGVWLADHEAGLLSVEEGIATSVWRPPSGQIRAITQLGDGILMAAGEGGAWTLQASATRPIDRLSGAPSSVAHCVAPTPTHTTAWLGTDRGVAWVRSDGTATPLPLAPLPAGVGVRQLVPAKRGAGVLSDDALVWLGKGRPRGWTDLAAAVGDRGRGLTRDGERRWWALADDVLFSLDRDGSLRRWPLDAEGIDLDASGDRIAVLTAAGLRTWVVGATMLSPTLRVDGTPQRVRLGPDGSAWVLTTDGLTQWTAQGPTAWPARDLHAFLPWGPGVALPRQDGLHWLGREDEPPGWAGTDLGTPVDVDTDGRRLWVLSADGSLWRGGPQGASQVDPLTLGLRGQPRRLVGDQGGVWVLTDEGAWRVADSP